MNRSRLLVLCVAAAGLVACARSASPPASGQVSSLRVTDIDVGRSVGVDKTIAEKTDTLRPTDTFYVSVKMEGAAPTATLAAQWTYAGNQKVAESTQTVAPSGTAVTEFHTSIDGPAGWPPGDYSVAILLNGVPAGAKAFRVQ